MRGGSLPRSIEIVGCADYCGALSETNESEASAATSTPYPEFGSPRCRTNQRRGEMGAFSGTENLETLAAPDGVDHFGLFATVNWWLPIPPYRFGPSRRSEDLVGLTNRSSRAGKLRGPFRASQVRACLEVGNLLSAYSVRSSTPAGSTVIKMIFIISAEGGAAKLRRGRVVACWHRASMQRTGSLHPTWKRM